MSGLAKRMLFKPVPVRKTWTEYMGFPQGRQGPVPYRSDSAVTPAGRAWATIEMASRQQGEGGMGELRGL
jgi:hypothetical protein